MIAILNKGVKMANKLRSVKATIIIAILLFSLFAAFTPVKAAPTWPTLNSNLDVSWGEEVEKPVIPRKEVRTLNLTLTYYVDVAGDIGQGMLDRYKNSPGALATVKIVDYSPWCIANLDLDTVEIPISEEKQESSFTLNMQLKDNAPAYGEGHITIKATVGKAAYIGGISKEFTLDFIAAYFPIISTDLPEGNAMEIGPMDSAIFPIEVENMGNARTKIFFEIENVPEGWTIAVTDDVTVGEKKGSKATAYLTVNPPRGFGTHHDRESINVMIVPARAENLLDRGTITYANFIVESRGFSTPGFEAILFIGALLAIVLIFKLKRKKSN